MINKIYLDYAAATPLDDQVLKAMQPYFSENFYNPSATYLPARQVRQELETARHKVASTIGGRPAEIIFTSGATEANNLAIRGLMPRYPEAEVLVSSIEHESVLEPAKIFKHKEIPVDEAGRIILNKLSNLISDNTVLVSIMLVNNELGTIQPLREVSHLIKNIRKERLANNNRTPIYLHTDAAQAANYASLQASRLGVDVMSINGGKIYGPKQSGVLYIKSGLKLWPQIVGGGQEFGLRSGTENIAADIGFAVALETAQKNHATQAKRTSKLSLKFEEGLKKLPKASINGSKNNRTPHILSVTFDGMDNERLMMKLDEAGILCAVGSACSASRDEPSHVLSAIGLSDDEARSTLRFSLGKFTTESDIEKTLQKLQALTASNR
ncbi:MAG TPA: cysteine desulfurase family protein [Candidatus Babeliales bacterium]|nr:cysteine desulfurase family protein [Candidatus Babeliales bacterium]